MSDELTIQDRLRSRPMVSTYISWGREAADRLDALEKALKSVEFGISGRCQICTGWMVGPHGETDRVHTKDCPIAAALRPSDHIDAQAGGIGIK